MEKPKNEKTTPETTKPNKTFYERHPRIRLFFYYSDEISKRVSLFFSVSYLVLAIIIMGVAFAAMPETMRNTLLPILGGALTLIAFPMWQSRQTRYADNLAKNYELNKDRYEKLTTILLAMSYATEKMKEHHQLLSEFIAKEQTNLNLYFESRLILLLDLIILESNDGGNNRLLREYIKQSLRYIRKISGVNGKYYLLRRVLDQSAEHKE